MPPNSYDSGLCSVSFLALFFSENTLDELLAAARSGHVIFDKYALKPTPAIRLQFLEVFGFLFGIGVIDRSGGYFKNAAIVM